MLELRSLVADDNVLVAHTMEDIQKIVDAFSSASKKFGLKINIKKTEVLYRPSSSIPTSHPSVKVDGKDLLCVQEFTYLGQRLALFSEGYGIDYGITIMCQPGSSVKSIVQSFCLYFTIRCRNLDIVQEPSEKVPRLHDETPTSDHENFMAR